MVHSYRPNTSGRGGQGGRFSEGASRGWILRWAVYGQVRVMEYTAEGLRVLLDGREWKLASR
jgi:hypothetical protein